MSELKSHDLVDIQDYRGEVYLKSEADKVIAELKDKLQNVSELLTETRELLIESQRLHKRCADGAIKKIRHHKYKRCLAMEQEWRSYAAFCGIQSSWHNNRGFGKTAEKWTWKECHAWRCVKRWMEIAEKIKEAK